MTRRLFKALGWLVFAAPLLLKAAYVDQFIYHYTQTRLLGFGQVLANDAVIYAGLLLLLYLPRWHRIAWPMASALRLVGCVVWLIYWIDYLVIVNFNTHLVLGDAIKYAHYTTKYLQQIYGLNETALLVLGCLAVLISFGLVFSRPRTARPGIQRWTLAMIFGLPLISGFTDNDRYVHAWIYRNVFDYNLTILSESSPYSADFLDQFRLTEASDCQVTSAQRKNIVILMVESLSSYQSRFFSGIADWTPNLDAIAAGHLAFTQFYANGFITEDGEVALLTGLPPIYPPSSYNDEGGVSFQSFYGIEQSLPKRLGSLGYRSEFLTSADLDFGNTGVWATSIGFDYVEGHDHPEYNAWPRFHFQAAPDEALYRRALDRIRQADQPLLLFIKTVSTHHPYVNPENGHESEAEAFQYADKQLGNFYRQLVAEHFFANGLLLIVGDHHAMTPLRSQETRRFGHYQASAKVPLVVVGATASALTTAEPFQQTDVFNTLQGMVSGRQCHDDWQGVLWGDASVSPRFILHRRGDNRDKLSVFGKGADYLVKLDGNATRIITRQPEEQPVRQMIVNKVNALRIARLQWLSVERSGGTSD